MQPTINYTTYRAKSSPLQDAFDDFILSRKAMRCSTSTIEFYQYTAHPFIAWAERQNKIAHPDQIDVRMVREFLAEVGNRSTSDWTINDNARAIRTLLRFWYSEGVIPEPVKFQMPKVRKKKMSVLSADELQELITFCKRPQDKALVLFMVDSGLRRAEVIALNWSDLNLENGICRVISGKGGKSRVAVIGPTTRKATQEYRNTLSNVRDEDPLFQSRQGTRFTPGGLLQVFCRLSKRSGIHVTPHTMRRTFVKLALRSKMNPLHLKDLLGHESLDMVMYYAGQFDEEELLEAHNEHSPIEYLRKTHSAV